MTLLELAAHLEGKVAQSKWEGLSKIKITLTGTDTSSLTRLPEGCLVVWNQVLLHLLLLMSQYLQKNIQLRKSESVPSLPITESSLATAELVFPMKSIPLVVAGITEVFLPLCSPETLSHYRCQYPIVHKPFHRKWQPVTTFIMII